ncbi:MAG: NAD(P)/FAD-dependent oxidoreductase [Verrucomicrobiota bacterium]
MSRPKVVIIGGGFAGIECAKKLRKQDVDVVIVDRQNHHLFQPLLYQVASAGLAAPEIAHPIRTIFARDKNIRVLMDEVTGIDFDKKEVSTTEKELSYDYLVIAMGVQTGYFGNDHWKPFARGLKSLDDATAMRRDLLFAFEKADACDDPEERQRLMTIGVIGGGPTGVELAGAFAELARHVLQRDFKYLDTDKARILLIEAAPRLLTMYDESLSDYTRRALEGMGVHVMVNSPVKDLRAGEIELVNETIKAGNIIWAAGIEAPPITKTFDVETDRAGRIVVETDLSVKSHPEVFAAGDIAHCIDQGGVLVPGVSPAAMQMGKHIAKVILDEVEGAVPASYPVRKQFRYFDKGSMATIGRSHAVAESMGLKFDGFIAWLMWLFIHLLFLVGFQNRMAVLTRWFYAYLRYKNGARIITGMRWRRPVKAVS